VTDRRGGIRKLFCFEPTILQGGAPPWIPVIFEFAFRSQTLTLRRNSGSFPILMPQAGPAFTARPHRQGRNRRQFFEKRCAIFREIPAMPPARPHQGKPRGRLDDAHAVLRLNYETPKGLISLVPPSLNRPFTKQLWRWRTKVAGPNHRSDKPLAWYDHDLREPQCQLHPSWARGPQPK
jgi:hypothetical protein